MDKFTALLVSGAVSGAVYSLLAVGLVLTYTTSGIFNFAHGAVAFTTAFLYYELNTGLGWPVWLAALASVAVFAPLLGVFFDKVIFRHLVKSSVSAKIVATVGLGVAIPGIALWFVELLVDSFEVGIPRGDNIYSAPGLGPVPKTVWSITDQIRIDSDQVIALAAGALAALVLGYLIRRTRLGLQMRAAVERQDLAESRGVDSRRVSSIAWALSFSLAGLAGVVGAPFFSLNPASYGTVLFVAASAAVLAGLRSMPLAFAAGLFLGVAQSMTAGYASFATTIVGFSTSVPFILLFIGLMVMNRDRSRVAGQVAESDIPIDHHGDLPPWRRALPWIIAGGAFSLYLFVIADEYWQGLLIKGLCYGLIFMSFTIVIGAGGLVSLAQAGFVTLAALTTGLLLAEGWPFALAAAAGVVLAAVTGALVALPSIRLGGLAFSIATLALALVGDRVLFGWRTLSNGSGGWSISPPVIGPIDLSDQRTLAVTVILAIALVMLGIRNLERSKTWRGVTAVRSAPPAALSIGISLTSTRVLVFALSAAVAGVGGIMLSTFNGGITGGTYPATIGLIWLSAVVLFGTRRTSGAIIAGIVFALSPEVIGWVSDSARIPTILFGLGAVQLARTPDGIVANISSANQRRRAARRARRAAGGSLSTDQTQVAEVVDTRAPIASASVDSPSDVGLVFERVRSGYGAVRVLHDVSLSVPPGSIVALLGPNGSGKSTLCKVAAGLLPVESGRLMAHSIDVTGRVGFARARCGFGYAPESRGIFPGLTVEENLMLTMRSAAERQQVFDWLPNLDARRKVPASNLSGGEQQMLAFAPFLVHPPDVLIADEPGLGLAPMIVGEVMALLRRIADGGAAVLVVEEKATNVLDVADRIAFLSLGSVTWQGSREEVDLDELSATYLGAQGSAS